MRQVGRRVWGVAEVFEFCGTHAMVVLTLGVFSRGDGAVFTLSFYSLFASIGGFGVALLVGSAALVSVAVVGMGRLAGVSHCAHQFST